MKTLAAASMLTLTTLALASASWAQTPARNRAYEPNAAGPSAAESDRGTVISVTPIVQQVAIPRRVCNDEPVTVQRQPSGAGALLGAIAGGAMGNAIGGGTGRAAATALGVFGGAVVGNNVEAGGQSPQVQNIRRCTTQSSYEERTTAYTVVYEYAGREYTTQMRRDPGRYVQVQVHAAPDGDAAAQYTPPARARSVPQPSSRPAPVYDERPVYQDYVEPAIQTYPVPVPVYYEPGYPQFGTGLVVGALIGYGASYYGRPYYGRGWRHGR